MFTNIISRSRSHIKFKAKAEEVIGELKPQLKPWEIFDYSPDKERAMYVGWGIHCAWLQQMELAKKYFNRALEIRSDDAKALFSRSNCERSLAKTMQAFDDSLRATYLEPFNPNIDAEFCYTLYELNEFEATLAEAKDISRIFEGPYRKLFEDFIHVTHENLKDSLGDSVGYFLNKHRRLCEQVLHQYKITNTIDSRPHWKILRDQQQCDVLSIPEKKEVLVHPLEEARRERALTVFYQKYLQRSWIDVISLRDISKNNKWLGRAFKESTPKLRDLLNTQTEAIRQFAKMLHARYPLYSEMENQNKHKKLWKKYRDSHLYRIQYQTRRNMFIILRNIRRLTEIGAIEKLSQYVEKAMGDYIIVKTYRIAPWKFEFMNDVYNSLALAYADGCTIPQGFDISESDAWEKLLRLPPPAEFSVGEKDIFSMAPKEKKEKSASGYRAYLRRMEKRLFFAQNSMEKAYIYHEVARAHFKANHMNECASLSQKGLQEAIQYKHHLFSFLCALIGARAQACNFKIDKSLQDIIKANEYAHALKSFKLINYTDLARTLVEMKISEQRSASKVMDKRNRLKTRPSNGSNTAQSNRSSESSITNADQQSTHSD